MKKASSHDLIAKRIAWAHGGEYRAHKGADVVAPRFVGEVEVDPQEFDYAIRRQLNGYAKPRYLIVPDSLVKQAKERTQGLKVGVMDEHGKIRKKAEKPAPRSYAKASRSRR